MSGGRDGLPEKYVLVLQSTMAGTRAQTSNSDMALTILRAKGIEPVILDASDPENKERRDELFEASGLRGNFPQIFKVDGKTTTFLGDFDELQAMNEDGALVELSASIKSGDDVGSEQPPIPVRVDSTNPSLDPDEDSSDDEEETSYDGEGASDEEGEEEEGDDGAAAADDDDDRTDTESGEANPEDEGTRSLQEFGEGKKAEDTKNYNKMVQILAVAVCLFLILDVVLVVLVVTK